MVGLMNFGETSSESVRTCHYARCLCLQRYEPGMQYDAHKCLLQLLTKISFNIKDDYKFKVDKIEYHFAAILATFQIMMMY